LYRSKSLRGAAAYGQSNAALRRQHQGAAPAFSGVDPHPNIIQIWKSRSIVRIDGGSEANIACSSDLVLLR
jgi:hypothetical protein